MKIITYQYFLRFYSISFNDRMKCFLIMTMIIYCGDLFVAHEPLYIAFDDSEEEEFERN